MVSNIVETIDNVIASEEEAKRILIDLIENRSKVDIIDILRFSEWIDRTNNYSEDVAVILEKWLQENDYSMNDKFSYYKECMETPTFYTACN